MSKTPGRKIALGKAALGKAAFSLWVLASCVPLLLLVVLSGSIFWPYPDLLPRDFSFEYHRRVFGDARAFAAIGTSLALGFSSSLLTLAVSIPAGKALAHYDFAGKSAVKILSLIPMVVPGVVVTIGCHLSMIRLGLTNSFFGVVLIHSIFALPFGIRIMCNVFEIVGTRLQEQARVLGAGPAFTFFRVTLPQIVPGAQAAAILGFTISIAQYITTLMIGGGRIITITVLLVPHMGSGQTHIASVYSLLLIVAAVASLSLMETAVRRFYLNAPYVIG